MKYNLDNISNVNVSKNNFVNEDLSSADIVIYWGSTVALEAINKGIPVIHDNNSMESFLSYDPLFQLNHFKWEVNNGDSLVDKIEEIYSMPDKIFNEELKDAKEYINRYFWPVTEDRFGKFIINKIK